MTDVLAGPEPTGPADAALTAPAGSAADATPAPAGPLADAPAVPAGPGAGVGVSAGHGAAVRVPAGAGAGVAPAGSGASVDMPAALGAAMGVPAGPGDAVAVPAGADASVGVSAVPRASLGVPGCGGARAEVRVRRSGWGLVGPAFVVAVAYIDPGNFATNMAAGARHGYQLLWVIALADVVAMFVQYLSAKLGLATGRSLPELCRQRWPRPAVWLMWAQAELVVMATDLAEFVGAALALHLLLGLSMPAAGLATAVGTSLLLAVAPAGRRRFTVTITVLLMAVVLAFLWQLGRAGVSGEVLAGLVPDLGDGDSVLLACGIVGATVMPHAVYLHSGLTKAAGRRALRRTRGDIVFALGVAGLANVAMLVIAAAALHGRGGPFATLDDIRTGLAASLGPAVGVVFALALLVAGLASACVGTTSGEMVMSGFLGRRVPTVVRRLVTMAPALALLCVGLEPTTALLISQVVLSFGLPFALVPLVVLTSRRDVMGAAVNRRITVLLGGAVALVICGLNVLLVVSA
jgi:manganese transport protein